MGISIVGAGRGCEPRPPHERGEGGVSSPPPEGQPTPDSLGKITDATLMEAAVRAAQAAAELHRQEAGKLAPAQWSEKGTADFVTEVDREAERRIIQTLQDCFPTHSFLAEEGTRGERASTPASGSESTPAPIHWIVDPLDGTTNWLHGYPEYAVSLAALDAQGLRAALVLNSATGERFDALRGSGSRRDGEPIRVSDQASFRLALVGTGFPFKRSELVSPYLATLERVLRASSGVRRAGAAALDLCNLACGRLDAFWEMWLMPWDVAAGALIVWEAGGTFEPLDWKPPGDGEGPNKTGASGSTAVLLDAVQGAREFLEVCSGAARESELRAGSYMATNSRLREALQETLEGGFSPN